MLLKAGRILIAAGPWSDTLITPVHQLGPGIHPVRGQIVLLKSPTRLITRVLMLGKRYLVPRTDGRVLIGSTEEPEACSRRRTPPRRLPTSSTSRRGWFLRSPPRNWNVLGGLRPGTPDGLPFIGPVPGWDNVFVAAGHFRAGVQLSIGTAQVITELFTGQADLRAARGVRRWTASRSLGVRAAFRS